MTNKGLNREQRRRFMRIQNQAATSVIQSMPEIRRLSALISEGGELRELTEISNPKWAELVTEAASLYTLSGLSGVGESLPHGFELVRLLMGLAYVGGYQLGVGDEGGEGDDMG